jgi:hypothetical protein
MRVCAHDLAIGEPRMPKAAEPNISFAARIDMETEKRRRKLQAILNCSAPELVRRAFQALELSLKNRETEARVG